MMELEIRERQEDKLFTLLKIEKINRGLKVKVFVAHEFVVRGQ